jgi:hypothetical protein
MTNGYNATNQTQNIAWIASSRESQTTPKSGNVTRLTLLQTVRIRLYLWQTLIQSDQVADPKGNRLNLT